MGLMKKIVKGGMKFAAGNYYLATSLLMYLSFPAYDIWFLKGFPFFAWFSLVPVFLFVRGRKYGELVFYSFVAFFFGNLLTFSWIGYFGAKVSGGFTFIVALLIPALTAFMVTKVLLAEFLARRFEKLRFLIYPSLWIMIDWVQSLGFLAFPWTYWGYSQYPFTDFIQMARFTGVMGVTFSLVMFNYMVSEFFHEALNGDFLRSNRKGVFRLVSFKRLAVALVAIGIITAAGRVLLLANNPEPRRDLRVAMVQSCINPWDNWMRNRMRYFDQLAGYTRRAAAENPDLVVWSESATLEMFSYDFFHGNLNVFEEAVFELVREIGTPLLTGEIGRLVDGIHGVTSYQNNAVLIDAGGNVVKSYSKINLVPFGEWFPYERWFGWVKNIVDSFGASSFTPGTELATFDVRERKFGVLVCYEGIFFRHVRRYVALGVDFLVNITNDGWTDTYSGHMQHFAASVFRAVENGFWVVRAGNTGYSTLIDPYGRVRASMNILTKGYVTGDMDYRLNHGTFYGRFGDVFFFIVLAGIAVLLVIIMKEKAWQPLIIRFSRPPKAGGKTKFL